MVSSFSRTKKRRIEGTRRGNNSFGHLPLRLRVETILLTPWFVSHEPPLSEFLSHGIVALWFLLFPHEGNKEAKAHEEGIIPSCTLSLFLLGVEPLFLLFLHRKRSIEGRRREISPTFIIKLHSTSIAHSKLVAPLAVAFFLFL